MTPKAVGTGLKRKAWWRCDEGTDHIWQASISSRVSGRGCPYCAGYKVSYTNSLATTYPEVAAEWHPTKNGDLTPDNVVHGSNERAYWKCPKGEDHEWAATIVSRTRLGAGCPQCRGLVASAANNLADASPALAAQWHPTRNGSMRPEGVTPMSKKKAWWLCDNGPDHEWQADIGSRNAGRGCPFCAGVRVSVTNALGTLHPELIEEWHPSKNGALTSFDVTAGSSSVDAWWICRTNPQHTWSAPPVERVEGHGCPYCSGNRLSPENSLAAAAPSLMPEWDQERNSPTTPGDVSRGSNQKYWWKCSRDPEHSWQAPPKSRVNGSGCPKCAMPLHSSRSELELYESIVEAYPDFYVIQHARPDWLGRQHLDIYLPDINFAIEFHGRQHFEPVDFFGGEKALKRSRERDSRKAALCKQNGCRLIITRHGYDLDALLGKLDQAFEMLHAA